MMTAIGLFIIALCAVLGYYRGILRFAGAFGALFLGGLLASPLSFLTGWAVSRASWIPLALKSATAMVTTGVLVFLVAFILADLAIARREKRRKDAGMPARLWWEAWTGSILGGAWGLFLVLLVFTGIEMIGSVEEAVRDAAPRESSAAVSADARLITAEGRLAATGGGEEGRAGEHAVQPPSDAQSPGAQSPGTQSAAPQSPGDQPPAPPPSPETPPAGAAPSSSLKRSVDSSIFGAVVRRANPVNEKAVESIRGLSVVMQEPELMERFQQHPKVARLMENPKIVALSKDEEIRALIMSRQYYRLLDNEKVAALARDEEFIRELRDFDINAVLNEVRAKE